MSTLTSSIQYLDGMEPDHVKEIQKATEFFKYRVKMKETDGVIVEEFHRVNKASNRPLAHRYRITFYLDDERAQWPHFKGDFLTKTEVIQLLENLHPIWNMIKTHRVKKAIERSKRIKQLQRVSDLDEAKLAKW